MAASRDLHFRGERLDDADFSGSRLHSPNLEGARITDGWLQGADISGYIDGLRVNGVEVAPLVEAELDRRFPVRVKLRSVDPPGLSEAWAVIEDVWTRTITRARTLPEALLYERVDDDWSFVETLRHLIFATDTWLFRMVHHLAHPYHPWGLAGSFLTDPAGLGLDYEAKPSFNDVLAVRRERMDAVQEVMAGLTREELERVCIPPETSGHPTEAHSVLSCLHVILDEEWEHSRYANRDLDIVNPWTWQQKFGFTHAWRVEEARAIIFLAGQGPMSPDGMVVGQGDFESQARQTFENLATVLNQAGASLGDVVKLTTYLTDVTHLRDLGRVRNEFMNGNEPASTVVGVSALALPGMMIEIDAWAVV